MLGGRDWLVAAMLALLLLDFCGAVAVAVVAFAEPLAPQDATFCPKPKDRPVLETPQQVWEARSTGVSRFRFDGVLYVVENLPKEYIDYSSWYVRMP